MHHASVDEILYENIIFLFAQLSFIILNVRERYGLISARLHKPSEVREIAERSCLQRGPIFVSAMAFAVAACVNNSFIIPRVRRRKEEVFRYLFFQRERTSQIGRINHASSSKRCLSYQRAHRHELNCYTLVVNSNDIANFIQSNPTDAQPLVCRVLLLAFDRQRHLGESINDVYCTLLSTLDPRRYEHEPVNRT